MEEQIEQEVRYPLLHQERPWSAVRVGASRDARWHNVPEGVAVIDILDRMDLDRQAH